MATVCRCGLRTSQNGTTMKKTNLGSFLSSISALRAAKSLGQSSQHSRSNSELCHRNTLRCVSIDLVVPNQVFPASSTSSACFGAMPINCVTLAAGCRTSAPSGSSGKGNGNRKGRSGDSEENSAACHKGQTHV